MRYISPFLVFCSAILYTSSVYATHIYAGEITYQQIGSLELEAQFFLYTREANVPAHPNTSFICWGDDNCTTVTASNGDDIDGDGIPDGEVLRDGFRLIIYTGTHIYDSAGQYILHNPPMIGRPSSILNLNNPNSDQVPFHVQSKANVSETAEDNHSPILYEFPLLDEAVVGSAYKHTLNAFDLDGDSVEYSLVTPTMDKDIQVPAYESVDFIISGISNILTIDPLTGLLTWDSPQRPGKYLIAIKVTTYRDGNIQDEVVRDMLILVEDEEALPPVLNLTEASNYYEIAVGDTLLISASSSSNIGNDVQLTATGGMFEYFGAPATFEVSQPGNMVEGQFRWIPDAADLREEPYQVNFRAQDTSALLANLQPVRIKVVEQLTSTASTTSDVTLQVFPNPVRESLHISSPLHFEVMDYQIIDTQGRVVQTGQVTAQDTQIDIQLLPAGWYQLRCWSKGGFFATAKIVKQ